ncbi:hypothetical protein SE17_44405 [Kouleothrix aurantiaca]|uniref:Uncharacterized protein n=1 Tax=Kouleothrix aurantiaca TaxID=186479 RepID=A0A0P9CBQ0_9CHLR|nr:hypothetical protein SE17_44405 [Kouleothrix aurantiaca]
MVKREFLAENLACPECGAKLTQERDLFYCKDHGAFFQYSPQLLMRAPASASKNSDALLPWETRAKRT